MGKPKQTVTTSQKPTFDAVPWLTADLWPNITGAALELNSRPEAANPYSMTSAFNGDERAAYQMIRDMLGGSQSSIDKSVAAQEDALSRSGRPPTQAELDGYMNPFTENVLNRSIEKIQEFGDRDLMNVGSKAAMSGAFGGSRDALLRATSMNNTNKTAGDVFYSGMKDNYDSALANYLAGIDQQSNMAERTMQSGFGKQKYALGDAAALESVGSAIRGKHDTDLSLAAQDWQRQRDESYKDLQALTLAAGSMTPGIGQNSKQTTQQSGGELGQLLGLASAAAGLATGNPAAILGGGSSILGKLGGGATGALGGGGLGGLLSGMGMGGWGGFNEGGLINEKRKPDAKNSYAYGGRVGNPFSQGQSAEVIQATQNPFNPQQTSGVMPSGVGVDNRMITPQDNSVISPSVNTPVGPAPSAMNPFAPQSVGGFTSPDLLMPPDRGGNGVARLMDMFKNGAPGGIAPMPQNTVGGALPVGTTPVMNMYAQGGKVKGKSPLAGSTETRPNPLEGALSALMGGLQGTQSLGKPVSLQPQVQEQPQGLGAQLFSPEGLLMMGLQMLANPGDPLQSLGQSALGTLNYFKEQGQAGMVDPMEQLKLETQRLRNEDLMARMEDRGQDNERQDRQFYERLAAQEARAGNAQAAADARQMASLAAQEERFNRSQENIDRRAAEREKSKTQKSPSVASYPGLTNVVNSYNKAYNAERDPVTGEYADLPENYVPQIESYINMAMDAGDEATAMKLDALIAPSKARVKDSVKTIQESAYNIFGPGK